VKKFLVIGNPINHSLSPKIHNYWIKKNNIDAIYEKQKLNETDLENIVSQIRENKINGINVTVPFKKTIIPFLDELTSDANNTKSVNTIYVNNNRLIGDNTDIIGFQKSIEQLKYNLNKKVVFILGAGGVVPSIIFALIKMKASRIIISNRTKKKEEVLKDLFTNIEIVDWGKIPNFDMIINATSMGLKKDDVINLNFSSSVKGKFFYDVIYNPQETNFLKVGKKLKNTTLNGKMMFVFQAHAAFNIWHALEPDINEKVLKLLD